MSYRLGGRNSLAYLGVEPPQPPNLVVIKRPPTINDSQNFNIGTLWVVPAPPGPEEIWMLVSLSGGVATWVQLYPTGGGGASEFVEDSGIANSAAGILNVFGGNSTAGKNIHTFGSGNTVDIILNDSLLFPNTVSDGSEGVLFWGGNRFIHNYGTNNTFIGTNSGNLTLTVMSATTNSALGEDSLKSLTTGDSNVAVGNGSLEFTTSGDNQTSVGTNALFSVTTGRVNDGLGANVGNNGVVGITSGSFNVFIGGGDGADPVSAGSNYTGAESSNILIRNAGVNGESNVIRIGTEGTGHAEQDACYIAGIYNHMVDNGTAQVVFVDSLGKLGTNGGGTPANSQAFLAYQNGNTTDVRLLSPYSLGASVVMAIIFDKGSNVYIGSGAGAPATFTAPVTGEYVLNMTVTMGSGASQWTNTITTTGRTYKDGYIVNQIVTNVGLGCHTTEVIADMTAGDTATFTVTTNGSSSYGINGFTGGATTPLTWISGYLVE